MLERGDTAPTFSLPGAVDGEIERVSLSQYAGEGVVVLDPDLQVRYTRVSEGPNVIPDLEDVRGAIAAVAGDDGGLARYRSAYDRYLEGVTAFDRGLERVEEYLADAQDSHDAVRDCGEPTDPDELEDR